MTDTETTNIRPSVMTTHVPSQPDTDANPGDPAHWELTIYLPLVLASHDGSIRYNVTGAYRCGWYNVQEVADKACENLAAMLRADAYPWQDR